MTPRGRVTLKFVRALVLLGIVLIGGVARAEGDKCLDIPSLYRQCLDIKPLNVGKGFTPNERGVELAKGCTRLAMSYDEGKDCDAKTGEANPALAAKYYGMACRAGLSFACGMVGDLYDRGALPLKKGERKDMAMVMFYLYGCQVAIYGDKADVAHSCSMAGALSLQMAAEKKRPKDQAKGIKVAVDVLERGCKMGSDSACKLMSEVDKAFAGE